MQNVRVLSSLTNELIQVTSSTALRSMTSRQSSAPPLSTEIRSPSGNVRCTKYRGMSVLLVDWLPDMRPTYEPPHPPASGRSPMLGGADPHLSDAARACCARNVQRLIRDATPTAASSACPRTRRIPMLA